MAAASRQHRNGWEARTSARHTDAGGNEWAIHVDWATDSTGRSVPASVTLSSLGGSLGDPRPDNVEPHPVTRAVVESVAWSTVIWGSRGAVTRTAAESGNDTSRYAPEPSAAADEHERLLRHVADVYREVGGSRNPTAARDTWSALLRERPPITPRGGGSLTRTRVRTWLSQCRQPGRGYIAEDD